MTRWPGIDGGVVLASGLVLTASWAFTGAGAGGHWLALVLGLDVLWLTVTFWSRR